MRFEHAPEHRNTHAGVVTMARLMELRKLTRGYLAVALVSYHPDTAAKYSAALFRYERELEFRKKKS